MDKARGGDRIPDELFQILKDDAVKVLHSIYQQIWKTQQWPYTTGKDQFSFQFQRRVVSSALSEVIDISPSNLDFSLCFIQLSISHDVLCL